MTSGDFNLGLLDEILKHESLQMIGCCNELNAGYAADGYARISPSGIAVIVVTQMVGTLSVINAIAGAYSEKLKVIVINGTFRSSDYQSSRTIHHTLGGVDKDHSLNIYQQVTCASVRLRPASDIGIQLDLVLEQCIEKSLPVYIEIPMDTLQIMCSEPKAFAPDRFAPLNDRSVAAVELIGKTWAAAKNPILMIGGLARLYLSHDMISSLASKLGCAVFCHPDGKSQISSSHPQFCGIFWSKVSDPGILTTVMESDLWIVICGRWSDLHTIGSAIDIEKEQHRILDLQEDHILMPDGTLLQGVTLQKIVNEICRSSIRQNDTSLHNFNAVRPTPVNGLIIPSPHTPVTVTHITRGIESILRKNDIVLADAGDCWFNAMSMDLPDGVELHIQMVYASIGWGLPAALGSQLAQIDGRTILMIGDGAFQMTAQEVSTMIRKRSNAIVFIFNNLGYRVEVRYPPLPT